MSFKENLLSKSNSYNHYKQENKKLLDDNEKLKKENEMLKQEILNVKKSALKDDYYAAYGTAGSFCNWSYIEKFLDDDFEDKFKETLRYLDKQNKKDFKLYYLRAMASAVICWDSLYFEKEELDQERFTEFKINNSTANEIAGFKFEGEYNLHPFIDLNLTNDDKEFLKNRDIIDAGAFTGDTSLPLSKVTNKNVYAFEPFKDSFELLKKNISSNNIENIVPVQKSLGNINGERTLYLSGSNVQGITSDPKIRNYDNELKVQETTIDKFVEENNLDVGLITADVEGAEMDLLKGAINTIITQKPILHISIYHKVSDFFDIIPWIANLNLGYEFKIVKEQPWSFIVDTIVQCRAK